MKQPNRMDWRYLAWGGSVAVGLGVLLPFWTYQGYSKSLLAFGLSAFFVVPAVACALLAFSRKPGGLYAVAPMSFFFTTMMILAFTEEGTPGAGMLMVGVGPILWLFAARLGVESTDELLPTRASKPPRSNAWLIKGPRAAEANQNAFFGVNGELASVDGQASFTAASGVIFAASLDELREIHTTRSSLAEISASSWAAWRRGTLLALKIQDENYLIAFMPSTVTWDLFSMVEDAGLVMALQMEHHLGFILFNLLKLEDLNKRKQQIQEQREAARDSLQATQEVAEAWRIALEPPTAARSN